MIKAFEELAYSRTPLGELSLRRRRLSTQEPYIYEIKLGDEFLMSSLFTEGETALAELGLQPLVPNRLDVAVGGLGLGYTAASVLRNPRVKSLCVIEKFPEVIEWHCKDVVPLGRVLTADPRCHLLEGDFFAIFGVPVREEDVGIGGRKLHAILVDIDHSPRCLLSPAHETFYKPDGLRAMATHLHPGGIFALWSNDPPDDKLLDVLFEIFDVSQAKIVTFNNPLQNGMAASTIYIARAVHERPQVHRSPS